MRAIVTGMIATYPVGGVAWDYGQYALGLERLGFEVYYLEDTGLPSYTYDAEAGGYVEDCSYGVRFLQEALALLSPTLSSRWHFRAVDGTTYGVPAKEMAEIVAETDILLNVSGGCLLRPEYGACRRKAFIDTDPGWNHFVIFPTWDSKSVDERGMGYRAHDYFFTYALQLGYPECPLPDMGLRWHATRPPVVLDCWDQEPPGEKWTTVTMWNNYEKPIEHQGRSYGSKEVEFRRVEAIPSRSSVSFELAVYAVNRNVLPLERWHGLGWDVLDGRTVSETPDGYRSYLQSSRGEFSVAKNIYVATQSGWTSCRSICYLAAGRPAVIQDTGFSRFIPTGTGLLAFRSLDDAVTMIAAVEDNYQQHQKAAREIARTYFNSDYVLGELVAQAGLG